MGGGGTPAGDFSCAGVSQVSPALSIAQGHLHLLTEDLVWYHKTGRLLTLSHNLDIETLLQTCSCLMSGSSSSYLHESASNLGFSTTDPSDEFACCDAEVLKGSNLLSLTDENLEGKDDVANMSGGQSCEGNIFSEHGRGRNVFVR